MEREAEHSATELWLDAFFASFGQIFFRGRRLLGMLLFASLWLVPKVAIAAGASLLLATAVARVMRLRDEYIRDGLYGYSALLVGIGVAASYELSVETVALLAVAVIVTVPVTAAAHSAFWHTFNLPPLTLPFLLVFYLALGAAAPLGLTPSPLDLQGYFGASLPDVVEAYLRSAGAIFFLPRADVGLLILFSLLIHSRIAWFFSALGFGVAYALSSSVGMGDPASFYVMLGYNALLTSIALGGIWFVPSVSSLVLAVGGTTMSVLITVGSWAYLARGGLPILILPFNATVLLLLYAMRQRERDGRPKAVDFMLGSPEENLNFFNTRVARFGAHYTTRFLAPFSGEWICTQGPEGEHTHKGAWKHGMDFEVYEEEKAHRDTGTRLQDYFSYRLPVLAPADGVVAKVVDTVVDNPIGEPNLEDNWGNLVLTYHAPGLYSLVCHFVPGSIKVREGQHVRGGAELGQCGNSGRSAVPHIHFQLQSSPVVGAPTIPTELHDVISTDDGEVMRSTWVPNTGDQLRNVDPQGSLARWLTFPYGEPLWFEIDGKRESITAEIDLLGNRLLRSREHGARMYYGVTDRMFVVYDVIGSRHSVLHLLRAALGRVPLEENIHLRWEDRIAKRSLYFTWVREFAPLLHLGMPEIGYRFERTDGTLDVIGSAMNPRVHTVASFHPQRGLDRLVVRVGEDSRIARRIPDVEESESTKSIERGPKVSQIAG